MKILREGRMIKPVIFKCDICECTFIARWGEYKYRYKFWDRIKIYECMCPNCRSLIWKEIRLD